MVAYLIVAVGLSMDAMAVSVSSGICIPDLRLRHALRASLVFGLFQFFMPLIGWLLGALLRSKIEAVAPWLAFALLALVGGKMIFESFRLKNREACEDDESLKGILRPLHLIALATATSLDALAVGVSYSLLRIPIILPAAIIGIVTFALCLAGTEFGKRLGAAFKRRAEVAGGLMLIGIGIGFVLQHLLRS